MSVYLFDTECTGLVEPDIIQAAWINIGSQVPVNPWPADFLDDLKDFNFPFFDSLYKPSKRIEWGAVATHHLFMEDLENCKPSSTFKLPDDCSYLIGHNILFDYNAMSDHSNVTPRQICTYALASHLFDGADSLSLLALCYQFYGVSVRHLAKTAHHALTDCVLTGHLLDRIITQLRPATWEDLWTISEKCRIPKRIHFGKHKGSLLEDVPNGYMRWYLDQDDVDPCLAEGMRQVLKGTYSPPVFEKVLP